MYSDTLQFIFVHIYKTGGTSVEHALRQYAHLPNVKHQVAHKIRRNLGEEKFDKYFKFSIVRNPWDRMVSTYFYRLKRRYTSSDVTFEEFVRDFDQHERAVHFRFSQTKWLYDADGKLLMDRVLRFENLPKGFKGVCRKLKVGAALPHINKSNHKSYKSYYTPELRKLVAKRYQDDIENFGYSF